METRHRYTITDQGLAAESTEIHFPARPGESIAAFLTRLFSQQTFHALDELTLMLRGRHITVARIVRPARPGNVRPVCATQALLSACRDVANHVRGLVVMQVDETGTLVYLRSELFIDHGAGDVRRLADDLHLRRGDSVSVSDRGTQIMRQHCPGGIDS